MTKETVLNRILYHVAGGVALTTPLAEVIPRDGAWGVPWYTVHRAVRSNIEELDKDKQRPLIGACITAGFQLLQHVVAPLSDVTGICVIVALGTNPVNVPNNGVFEGPPYELAYLLHGGELTGLADSICPLRRCIAM